MVSLSDIPIVGKAVDKISEATVNAVYRGLRYMFCYKSIVNNFNSEFKNFKIEEDRVSTKVDEEKNNGKIIEKNVTDWQEEVEGIQQDSEEFLERYENRASWKCIKCVPIPNPLNRFRIGRDAEKKAEKLAALTQSGKDLLANPIARLPPVENLPKTDGKFQNFQSRKDAYEKIWKSLVSEGGPQILGIYGMPGVGKTRIAEQIWKDAKEKGIFDKVTKAVVSSGKLDVIKLQHDLAKHLNCTFASQDNDDRSASQLKHSIMNGGKVLIILDDVWREVPLDVIGIPLGNDTTSSKGTCKILLTSREESVLRGNKCIDPVKITALKDDEAWDMFKESVGSGDIPDESLARKVCDKCAGLPLVIRAVGKALMKFNSRDMWKDALQRLENCEIESVPGIDAEVYACLKLSFDKLEKDAKLCLLLCSLYPEDALIPISMLIDLATGSQLVRGGQIRVRAMVALLKSSSLVLESENKFLPDHFRLHDIIRDVARSIAQNDHAFIFPKSSDSRLLRITGNPELLCLEVNNNNFNFPDEMSLYQDIHTLWIGSISNKRLMLQVWKVAGMCVNLRCLVLQKIEWEVPVELYSERAQFVSLVNVDVSSSSSIFNCSTAEEAFADLKHLYIEKSDTMEHVAARISHHHHHIQPRTSSFFKQLTTLLITNCSAMRYLFSNSVAKCLVQLERLWVVNCNVMEAIVMNDGSSSIDGQQDIIIINFPKLKILGLISMPQLKSFYLDNMKVIIYSTNLFDDKIAFPALEELGLRSLSISDIWGKHYFNDSASSFSKLKMLGVQGCTKLETVIPLAMLHKLQNLEYLEIKDCSSVIHEVGTYDDNNTAVVCPLLALTRMQLHKLPCLTKTWLNSILDHSAGAILTNLYPNLKELFIYECNGLSNVFLPCIAGDLMHLRELHLDSCKMMTEIIGAAAGHDYNIMSKDVFPNLVTCRIMCCDKINFKDTEFWRDGVPCQLKSLSFGWDEEIQLNIPCTWDLRNLEELTLANCWWHEQHIIPSFSRLRKLKVIKSGQSTLFPVSVISSLQQLQDLEISDCALLEDIVTRGNAEASSTDKKIIEFIQLKRVVLKDLPKLRCFMSGADYECHMPALEKVEIGNCGFSTLFPFSVISSLQQLWEIKISNCALLEGIVEEDVRKRGNIEASSSRDKKKKIIKLFELRHVSLKDLPNLRSFMYGADYECHMPALDRVYIDNCGFSTLFTCSTNLQQLCQLRVSNCKLLEYIVRDDDDDDDISKTDDKIITTLYHLYYIHLENLPNLKSFSPASRYDFNMPKLSDFTLLQCPQVENFSSLKTSTKSSIRVKSDWDKDGKHITDLNDYIKQNQKRDDSNLISDDEGAAAGETIDSNFSTTD